MAQAESVTQIQRHLEQLLRMSASRRVYANQAETAGVVMSQPAYVLLRCISQDGPLPMGELARRAHMDAGATARQVGQLERDGLVRRYASSEDGRVNLVVVTPPGLRVHQRLASVLHGHMVGVLAQWSEKDRQDFAKLMGRFVEDLRESNYPAVEAASS
ncbi:MAG: MarR family winged helix-turn-helix transcriptional regulator [Actinomycetes bacterium]